MSDKKTSIIQTVATVSSIIVCMAGVVWGAAMISASTKANTEMLGEVRNAMRSLNTKVYDHEARLAVVETKVRR